MAQTVALTGATGFIGRHLAAALSADGHRVRALTRRQDGGLTNLGVEQWIGSLDSRLDGFLIDSSILVHTAGAIRARDTGQFQSVNGGGSKRLAAAAPDGTLFVQLSSLAARQPQLSPYAESKAAGERLVLAHKVRLQVVVVRPPAVYGPGDRSTLPLIRGLARGLLVHPGTSNARFSLLYAEDLVHLVRSILADPPPTGTILEPDDGTPNGYDWGELAVAASERLHRRVRMVAVPRPPVAMAAWLLERWGRRSGSPPILSVGKVAELYHRDWVSDTRAMGTVTGWQPQVRFGDGLVASLDWYRSAGWL